MYAQRDARFRALVNACRALAVRYDRHPARVARAARTVARTRNRRRSDRTAGRTFRRRRRFAVLSLWRRARRRRTRGDRAAAATSRASRSSARVTGTSRPDRARRSSHRSSPAERTSCWWGSEVRSKNTGSRNFSARTKCGVGIGVGGSFDVLAGTVPRAPRVWRRAGLEWLYRLIREPSRWRRQLALPRFAFAATREAMTQRGSRRR